LTEAARYWNAMPMACQKPVLVSRSRDGLRAGTTAFAFSFEPYPTKGPNMTEERTTTYETPEGNTHTTTVVTDERRSRGGSGTWMIALVLLVAVIAGFILYTQMGGAEAAKDNAIAEAADDVGNAATQVGDAAEEAADSLTQE